MMMTVVMELFYLILLCLLPAVCAVEGKPAIYSCKCPLIPLLIYLFNISPVSASVPEWRQWFCLNMVQ